MERYFCSCVYCTKKGSNGCFISKRTFILHQKKYNSNHEKFENIDVDELYDNFLLDKKRKIINDNIIDNHEKFFDEFCNNEEVDNDKYDNHEGKDGNKGESESEYGSDSYEDDDRNKDESESDNYEGKGRSKDESESEYGSKSENDDDYDNYDDYDDYDGGDDDDDGSKKISDDTILGLRLLNIKVKHGLTDMAFDELLETFNISTSLYKIKKMLSKSINIDYLTIDTCVNSCIAFTNAYKNLLSCPLCDEPRFSEKNKPLNQTFMFPLKSRFLLQYKNPKRAEELRYRYDHTNNLDSNKYQDIFDGSLYDELLQKGYFKNKTDIALSASIDGFQIFKQKTNDCWAVLFINNNLNPQIRVKKKNLLLSMIIPGPKSPKDINSFLFPLINELVELEEGVPCYDGYSKENFVLKAHVISWSGDIPGISKILNLTGHNSYKGCRFCHIKGTPHLSNKHIYYPYNNNFDFQLRTHKEINDFAKKLNNQKSKKETNYLIKKYGIKEYSIIFNLKTIIFPWSFPIDIMHLFFENVAPLMYSHWNNTFFKDCITDDDFIIEKEKLMEIGENLKLSRIEMPSSIGRPPRDIYKYNAGFKAVEWRNWIIFFSLPILNDVFNNVHIKGWSNFVKSVKICVQYEITKDDLENLKISLRNFYKYYEKEYYKNNPIRLSACRICFHYLLHVAECIEYLGPCWSYWQFPMERLCGMLQLLINSKSKPYLNIANNFSLIEKYNHLAYIFDDNNLFEKKEKIWPENQVIGGIEDYEEELYFPSKEYILNEKEYNKLKAFYGNKDLEEIKNKGRKYGRLLTSDGHIISSIYNHRTEISSKKNYYVEFRRTIDKYSHLKNVIPELILTKAYGKVEYFLVHQYQNKTKFLAFIQTTSKLVENSNLEIKYFTKFTTYEFIDVRLIDHCIGLLKLGFKYYIVDKENNADEEWEDI